MRRYDSYKDSGVEWIGEIPDNWGVTKMKYVGDYLNGYPFKPTDWGDEGRLIIRIQNLTEGRGSENFYSGEIDPKYIVRTGDYLFSWSTTLGLYEWKRDEGLLNQHIFKVELNDILFKKYYFWVIQGVIKELSNESHGSTMTHLTKDVFGNIRLPLPPLSEQQQIVSFLDTKTSLIDSLIEKTKLKIQLLKENRTSLINEVVTKGLNPNVEMKDSGVEWIGEIPSHWRITKLHTLVTSQKLEFQDGNHGGLHPIPEEFLDEGVPFIKPKDIQNEKVLWDTCDRLPFERCEQFRIGFSNNDDVLLVNRGGSIGKVVYVSNFDNEYPYFIINPQVTYMRGKNGLVSKFLFYVSLSDIFQCGIHLILGHGSTFPFLGLSNMGNFEMVYPGESEQNEIVSYLDEHTQLIDKTISVEERRIELLKEYRQSLISEVVTGKRKVLN
jgi:type I restriction enzyme S subunit